MSEKTGDANSAQAADISQYKVDYQPWKADRAQRVEARPQWEAPTGRVEGRSETTEQFAAHPLEPRRQREKAEWQPPQEKFGGVTVNRADFQAKYLPKEQPVRPKDELERTTAPFDATPLSREEFRAWQTQPRPRREPPTYRKPEGTMESATSYSTNFTPGRTQVRLPPIKPPVRTQPSKPFQGVSESAERFREFHPADAAGAKQASFRPEQAYRPPSRPLEGRSSYSGDFVRDANSRSERTQPVRHSGELRLTAEPMETWTTNRGDYPRPDQAERRQPIRHGGELGRSSEPFGGVSTQREDFSPRWQPRRQPIRHGGELQVSNDPFGANTVMKEDFVARKGERPTPVRQRGELQLSGEPMAASTTSRDVYTPKRRDGPPPTRRPQATQAVKAAS